MEPSLPSVAMSDRLGLQARNFGQDRLALGGRDFGLQQAVEIPQPVLYPLPTLDDPWHHHEHRFAQADDRGVDRKPTAVRATMNRNAVRTRGPSGDNRGL